MSEKKLTEEELAEAQGGAQMNISAEKTANRGALQGGGSAQQPSQSGDPRSHEPFVADNGMTATPGG